MTTQPLHSSEVADDRLAKAIAAHLSSATDDMPHDVTERLRAARVQALAKRKREIQQTVTAPVLATVDAGISLGSTDGGWWNRLTSALALVALVAGLVGIADLQDELRASELAEIDAELLTDDLPPSAYTDPGFAQFLRSNPDR